MSREPSCIFISSRRFQFVLNRENLSMNKLALVKPHVASRRQLTRIMSEEKINPNMLNRLAEYLDVSPDYLTEKELIYADMEILQRIYHDRPDLLKKIVDPDGYIIPGYGQYQIGLEEDEVYKTLYQYLTTAYNGTKLEETQKDGTSIVFELNKELLGRHISMIRSAFDGAIEEYFKKVMMEETKDA